MFKHTDYILDVSPLSVECVVVLLLEISEASGRWESNLCVLRQFIRGISKQEFVIIEISIFKLKSTHCIIHV